MTAKTRAIPVRHRDNSLHANGTINRMASPVTQPPFIAGPLGCIVRPYFYNRCILGFMKFRFYADGH